LEESRAAEDLDRLVEGLDKTVERGGVARTTVSWYAPRGVR